MRVNIFTPSFHNAHATREHFSSFAIRQRHPITALPDRANKYAVVRPAMPAPTITTLVLVSWLSAFSEGGSAVAIHTEMVVPEVGFIVRIVKRGTCQSANRAGCHERL